jgi:hypothetical protein
VPRGRRPPVRVLVAVAAAAAGLVSTLAPSGADVAAPAAPRSGGAVGVYRGLGTWVDIFDRTYRHPREAVRSMARRGVRTLYLETSNYRQRSAFVYRSKVARFLDAAEANGVHTVAWYLPSFRHVRRDLRRSLAAVRLTTRKGNRFDSFALDIESSAVRDPGARNDRLLRLSAGLRSAVGDGYPLGAIIPSPTGMERAGRYWPRFPYRQLASYYDAIVPMSYSTWHVSGMHRTHRYTEQNVKIIRRETGAPTFPIHVLGGIADASSAAETRGFVRAVRERGVVGASLYDFPLTRSGHWRILRRVPVNPVQRPALPARLGTSAALGNIPGGDRTHPKEVFFTTGGTAGARVLSFDAFDVQRNEVDIFVNWERVGHVVKGPERAWSGTLTRRIRDRFLTRRGTNVIAFVARGDFPDWSRWGIRAVSLTKP